MITLCLLSATKAARFIFYLLIWLPARSCLPSDLSVTCRSMKRERLHAGWTLEDKNFISLLIPREGQCLPENFEDFEKTSSSGMTSGSDCRLSGIPLLYRTRIVRGLAFQYAPITTLSTHLRPLHVRELLWFFFFKWACFSRSWVTVTSVTAMQWQIKQHCYIHTYSIQYSTSVFVQWRAMCVPRPPVMSYLFHPNSIGHS